MPVTRARSPKERPAAGLRAASQGRTVDGVPYCRVLNANARTESLLLDLYLPEDGSSTTRPAIMWVHGGGFKPGNDRKQAYIPLFAREFAARGYVGVAPDYRLREDPGADRLGTTRDAVDDLRAAVEWMRADGRDYGIDPDRLALAGGSAGGIAVLNLCHHPERPVDGRHGVAAVIGLWGAPGPGSRLFAAPNPRSPATLLIHGDADTIVPYAHSVALLQELAGARIEHELLTLPGAGHTPTHHMQQMVTVIEHFLHKHLQRAE